MQDSLQATNSLAKSSPNNGAVNEAASSAHGFVDKVATAANSAVQKVNTAIGSAAESGHHAVAKVEETVAPAGRWMNETTNAVLAAPKNAVADARQYIVAHPWQSLTAALFAGVLLGRRNR